MLQKKRLLLITGLTFLGAILFIPFLLINNNDLKQTEIIQSCVIFTLISTFVAAITSWLGFKFSDKLNIPMPLLRNWELGNRYDKRNIKSIVSIAIVVGIIVATLTIIGNYFVSPPTNKGNFIVRISTTLWASVVTETLSHLFVLSGFILLFKKKWMSLFLSGLIFVLIFHFSTQYDLNTNIYLGTMNFIAASVTGYLFIKFGFECALISHFIMHFLLLGINI